MDPAHRNRVKCLALALAAAWLLAASAGCKQPTPEQEARAAVVQLIGRPRVESEEAQDEPSWGSYGGEPSGLFRYDLARSWRDDGTRIKLLILGLRDGDPKVRAIAARALGVIGDKRAIGPLTDAFWRSVDADDRTYPDRAKSPRKAYRLHFERVCRHQCVWALRRLIVPGQCDERALPVLAKATSDVDQHVQLEALMVLCTLGTPGALQALHDVASWRDPLDGGDGFVREEARKWIKVLESEGPLVLPRKLEEAAGRKRRGS